MTPGTLGLFYIAQSSEPRPLYEPTRPHPAPRPVAWASPQTQTTVDAVVVGEYEHRYSDGIRGTVVLNVHS